MPTKTATRRRTATPQLFPVSIFQFSHTLLAAVLYDEQGQIEHVQLLQSASSVVTRAGYSGSVEVVSSMGRNN